MKGSKYSHLLWYRQSAKNWNEALPLGNGRIGAMIYGDAENEKISLNEDTLWSGGPVNIDGEYSDIYNKAKQLVLDGKPAEAQSLIENKFGNSLVQMYLPLADLNIKMNHNGKIEKYKRQLELDKSLHTVTYETDGIQYERKTIVSYPYQVMAVEISANIAGSIGFTVNLDAAMPSEKMLSNNIQFIKGNCPVFNETVGCKHDENSKIYSDYDSDKGIAYKAGVTVKTDKGQIKFDKNGITVKNADRAIIYFAGRTSFNGPFKHPVLEGEEYEKKCENDILNATKIDVSTLFNDSITEHKRLYDRTELDLGITDNSHLPTDQRLKLHSDGVCDNSLYALIFHFGRYLTISASRNGTQPMNLQGIWNAEKVPPWSSNYTLNINTEMNYWPTLSAGLEECFEPLLRFVKELRVSGKKTAEMFYGADGFVSHHASDIWRVTHPSTNLLPESAKWGFWNMSSGWLCAMIMNYCRFKNDTEILKEYYPLIKDCADFYCSLLTEVDGYSVVCPSTSPENNYIDDCGNVCSIDVTTTMTDEIVRDVLKAVVEAGEKLGIDTQKYKTVLEKLRPIEMSEDGSVREWWRDKSRWEEHHRHISHLYGLFPSNQINKDTPKLLEAARKTLEERGDKSTGWSIAWKINLWARLFDGNRALKLLDMFLKPVKSEAERDSGGGCYVSLLCAHPPFQIDGNFGVCNAILEMLVNNSGDEPLFLPALPDAWKSGALYGYALSSKHNIDVIWENGKLKNVIDIK